MRIYFSLILAVNEIEGIKRIRLGSLEPRIITEDFVKTISGLEKDVSAFSSFAAKRMR